MTTSEKSINKKTTSTTAKKATGANTDFFESVKKETKAKTEKVTAKAKETAKKVTATAKDATKKASKTVKANAKKANESVKETTKQAIKNAEEVTNNAINVVETATGMLENMATYARNIVQETGAQNYKKLQESLGKLTNSANGLSEVIASAEANKQALSQASDIVSEKSQELSEELLSFYERIFSDNMDGINNLINCNTVQDFVDVKSNLYQSSINNMLEQANKNADILFVMLGDSYEPLKQRASDIANQIYKG